MREAPPHPARRAGVRFRRTPSALYREVGQEVLLASPDGEGFDALSGGAPAVWGLLDRPLTASELVAALAPRYEVPPERLRPDLERLLEELCRRGWIEEVPAGHA